MWLCVPARKICIGIVIHRDPGVVIVIVRVRVLARIIDRAGVIMFHPVVVLVIVSVVDRVRIIVRVIVIVLNFVVVCSCA